jgi:hypothetical protein
MGAAIAVGMGVAVLALASVLMWGLWHIRMPVFGSRVRRGRPQSWDRSKGEWVDGYPLRHRD